MSDYPNNVQERARKVRMLLLDVDGVLTDGTVYMDNSGVEAKGFNIMDGLGLNLLGRAGIDIGIITGRHSAVVAHRARELNIALVVQGCRDKLAAAEEIILDRELSFEQLAFVGDDLIDLTLLKRVGLPLSVPNGAEEVRAVACHVTHKRGGRGAVREVAELILKSQGLWQAAVERFQ